MNFGFQAKGSAKKSKNERSEAAEELPYVHVRARRGQATDSHSLAERVSSLDQTLLTH